MRYRDGRGETCVALLVGNQSQIGCL